MTADASSPIVHEWRGIASAPRDRREMARGYEWSGFDNMHRATHWTALPPVPEATT